MKHTMLKIWSLTMVMVVSISTSGFAINKHFCGGKEKTKALFFEAEKCAFESQKVCQKHLDESLSRKNCCEDKAFFFKQLLTVDLDLSQVDNTVDVYDIQSLEFDLRTPNVILSERLPFTYRPPPIEKDVTILFQTFLL